MGEFMPLFQRKVITMDYEDYLKLENKSEAFNKIILDIMNEKPFDKIISDILDTKTLNQTQTRYFEILNRSIKGES